MELPMILRYGVMALLLVICTISDIKSRMVYSPVLIVSALAAVILEVVFRDIAIPFIAGGVATGLILLGVSIASREKIGIGDALVVIISGLCLGFWPTASILVFSVFAAGLAGLAAMVVFKKPRDYGLPFMPFLLGAFAVYVSFGITYFG